MKKTTITRALSRPLSLFLALALALLCSVALFSCSPRTEALPDKEEILANIEERDGGFSTVHEYLADWGIHSFNTLKMTRIESVYKKYFYQELPSAKAFAKKVATIFLEECYDELENPDQAELTDALINCFVAATEDRYAYYRTAKEYSEYLTDMSGTFVGIGVTVRYENEKITIIRLVPDAPAIEAGMKVGDILVAVDGTPVSEAGYEASVNSIRGEEGTQVTLTLERDGELIDITATRRAVVEPTVEYELKDGIGYILVTSFKSTTAKQFIDAIDYMEKWRAEGLIFDLRTNTGGYLSAVSKMVGYLVPKGTPISSFTNNYAPTLTADSEHSISVPCVILTNEYTASASELFVAALLDYDEMGLIECTTVGKTTYGKGVMQTTVEFTDNTAITLTVAYFNSPLGKNHDGVGLVPDVEAEYSLEHDGQLEAAYEEIAKLIGAKAET